MPDGESDAFDAIPRVHGYPGEAVVAGDSAHGQCRTGKHQDDKRDDQDGDINISHSCIFYKCI